MNDCDVLVIGAGAGGGTVAGALARAGKRVIVLERGDWLDFEEIPRDHLRNHRVAVHGHNTGPKLAGHPRVFEPASGLARVVNPHEGPYQNNAMTVGGGTRVWGMQAWRFHPSDFEMASRYGVPAGSSLADWPIAHADLAPFYALAERELGVSGVGRRSAEEACLAEGYPMPPLTRSPQGDWLAHGARRLGWPTLTPPLALNSVPYGGRPACVRCGECIGFACPVDAKNGSHNTHLARALATGRCELRTRCHVSRIETDGAGRVVGAAYFSEGGQQKRLRARVVVLAAGAIETARLLLLSRSASHPDGLGNARDQVGRHLQGHYYPGARGLMPEPLENDGLGPGPCVATTRFAHGIPGVVGGAMLANDFVTLPIQYWREGLPPGVPRWGLANKQYVRATYRRIVHVTGPVQEIPSPLARVTLDRDVRDEWGLPVARLSGTTHPETVRTARFIRERAAEWLAAAGAREVWSQEPALHLSAGQHQAGTCRMGNDPRCSVTDATGRVHGHENLLVADGSVHVTNGAFNPALTIMALALRTAALVQQGS